MENIFIVNLGDITTQNQKAALEAFIKLLGANTFGALVGVLQHEDTVALIDAFKLGQINEVDFTNTMIDKIAKATQKPALTPEQFDEAWNAMNPVLAVYADLLKEIRLQNTDEQKIVLVSYTNPKDMAFLLSQLKDNKRGISYEVDEETGILKSIAGMPLYLTFVEKCSKADLIERIKVAMQSPNYQPGFHQTSNVQPEFIYVRGTNGMTDPIFAQLDAANAKKVSETNEDARIQTVFWDRKMRQTFAETIKAASSHIVPTALL